MPGVGTAPRADGVSVLVPDESSVKVAFVGREVHVGACVPTHPQRAEAYSSSTMAVPEYPWRYHDK